MFRPGADSEMKTRYLLVCACSCSFYPFPPLFRLFPLPPSLLVNLFNSEHTAGSKERLF